MRRNVDLNVILFNNRIYGLTMGQFSPTSEFGKVTKSSPYGTTERPLNPIRVALAAGATFVARSIDRDTKHLEETLYKASQHKGISFVEVYQNCNIFNDGAFAAFADKEVRQDKMIYLEHGKPLRFGKEMEHGIRLNGFQPEVVLDAGSDDELLVHDIHQQNISLANILVGMDYPEYPVPIGVFRDIEAPVFDQLVAEQVETAKAKGVGSLEAALHAGETWVVE
jgi:2-oxoglutarate ferredoxin oxidoreductase subunit beta